MYFHSIIDDQKRCDERVVNLRELEQDLKSVKTTRNYNFITPDLCSDGHDEECINAKQKGGYDGSPGIQGPGGGRIGMVLLSPYIRPGTAVTDEIDHYGYLRTIEDIYGLEHLGYAARDGVKTFIKAFNRIPNALGSGDVNRFKVRRKGKRIVIKVSLGPGVVGRIVVKRKGQTLRRFTTGGRATFRLKVPRTAKVILRAVKDARPSRSSSASASRLTLPFKDQPRGGRVLSRAGTRVILALRSGPRAATKSLPAAKRW